MDLDGIMLSEISLTEKDKCSMISFMQDLKNKTNKEENQTYIYREQTDGFQWEGGMGKMGEG